LPPRGKVPVPEPPNCLKLCHLAGICVCTGKYSTGNRFSIQQIYNVFRNDFKEFKDEMVLYRKRFLYSKKGTFKLL